LENPSEFGRRNKENSIMDERKLGMDKKYKD